MNFIAHSFHDYIPSILMMLHVIIRSQKEKAGFGPWMDRNYHNHHNKA